ncbi:homocysteine S-methyltransferase family protein [Pelagicoccus mobilis]|uniref:Homocysteine S-methyltransferase family protein n=1 Tax=Pelagicoccus mobilis TaxID=415221 RepID=A0A934VMW9_9BACT|nr:homocysteine S-methyltransferase family protein [Pelagicoccus mobilis]MBK1879291.1 homocysteine S-methyltransferase family protein [Pelagicoccus mobilis]
MESTRSDLASQLLTDRRFLTFAGTETYLLFQQGFNLRDFCAFEVLEDESAWKQLEQEMLIPILDAAAQAGHGVLTDSLCWRAAPDFVSSLGYSPEHIAHFNKLGSERIKSTIDTWRASSGKTEVDCPVILSTEIGPRGDGYAVPEAAITIQAARDYHRTQLSAIAQSHAHLAAALTMTNINESCGLAIAAKELDLPIVISPTIETDGRLPDGITLSDFIRTVDAITKAAPLFYMVNCAHPTHLEPVLAEAKANQEPWLDRLRGFRANASCKSHEELDNATELDRGDHQDLAQRMAEMSSNYGINVIGGCCGTDAEHIRSMIKSIG